MDVQLVGDPWDFTRRAAGFLEREAFTANVIGVVAERIAAGAQPPSEDAVWALVTNGLDEVVGVAMQTPPHFLFLPRLPEHAPELLAHLLAGARRPLPGVNGEAESGRRYAAEWRRLTGQSSEVQTAMRFYVLGTLRPPEGVNGSPRLATDADQAILTAWESAFFEEVNPQAPHDDPSDTARRRIAHGEAWLWEDGGEVVSMACVSKPSAGVARLGPVYTPLERRGHGYASSVTAVASQAGLDSGARHVALYADVRNATSNKIYQAIGYLPDHDAEERRFL